jgi:alkaline phosphatase D
VADNPHVRYFESRKRGYTTIDVEAGRITTKFRSVSDATDPAATVETLKSFIVEDGRPGAIGI